MQEESTVIKSCLKGTYSDRDEKSEKKEIDQHDHQGKISSCIVNNQKNFLLSYSLHPLPSIYLENYIEHKNE